MTELQRRAESTGIKENVSQLSGGERSITTVCLLLSLWQVIRSPIRCLDEYEVFMDSAHKTIATGLLCQTAREEPGTQFLFLTPTGICQEKEKLVKAYGDIFSYKSLQPPKRT